MIIVDVGNDFSTKPFGRYRTDGKFSAERFREECLVPALEKAEGANDQVVIVMDNVDPDFEYTSSFLEEAFGGLVRSLGFASSELLEHLKIESKDDHLWPELQFYIQCAAEGVQEGTE